MVYGSQHTFFVVENWLIIIMISYSAISRDQSSNIFPDIKGANKYFPNKGLCQRRAVVDGLVGFFLFWHHNLSLSLFSSLSFISKFIHLSIYPSTLSEINASYGTNYWVYWIYGICWCKLMEFQNKFPKNQHISFTLKFSSNTSSRIRVG